MAWSNSNSRRSTPLAEPPRSVPLLVRARVIMGSFSSVFGWAIFGFFMLFVWSSLEHGDTAFLRFGENAVTRGVVERVEKTEYEEGGDSKKNRPGTPIVRNSFRFEAASPDAPEAVTYRASSYSFGPVHAIGDEVEIEYPVGSPRLAIIRGERTGPIGCGLFITWIFPPIGLFFMLRGLRDGLRRVALLRDGRLTTGTLKDKSPTNTRINNRTVYKLTFEYAAAFQTFTTTARSHHVERFEDEPNEPLLYDPVDPWRAVLLDALPGTPRIDETGQIRSNQSWKGLALLAIPAVVLIIHVPLLIDWLRG